MSPRVTASALAVCGLLAACGAGNAAAADPEVVPSAHDVPPLSSYWTLSRLDRASPLGMRRSGGRARRQALASVRIGALFSGGPGGDHFCTASPVESPHDDLLITAAHCLYADGALRSNLAFVPGYSHGKAPYGVWTPKSFIIDERWERSADPAYDVAFVVLRPNDGKQISRVLGANAVAFNTSHTQLVRVTGYPESADAPITCVNRSSEQSATQLRFACAGFTGGTSGSPWVVRLDPLSRRGTVIGVIGGYEEGGSTADVSYSAYFGSGIEQLYSRAVAAG